MLAHFSPGALLTAPLEVVGQRPVAAWCLSAQSRTCSMLSRGR